jgi:hypothetical protein
VSGGERRPASRSPASRAHGADGVPHAGAARRTAMCITIRRPSLEHCEPIADAEPADVIGPHAQSLARDRRGSDPRLRIPVRRVAAESLVRVDTTNQPERPVTVHAHHHSHRPRVASPVWRLRLQPPGTQALAASRAGSHRGRAGHRAAFCGSATAALSRRHHRLAIGQRRHSRSAHLYRRPRHAPCRRRSPRGGASPSCATRSDGRSAGTRPDDARARAARAASLTSVR